MKMNRRFFLPISHSETLSQLAILPKTLAIVLFAQTLAADVQVSRVRFLMGTMCALESDTPVEATEEAFAEISRIEGALSTWRDDSELALLNLSADDEGAVASEELFDLLKLVVEWSDRTGQAFNPMIAPLLDVWQIRGDGGVPTESEIAEALSASSLDNISLDVATRTVRFAPGSRIEEGAFGKGYALDRAMEILKERGCHDCLIDFGGQIVVNSPTPVTVAVAQPDARDREALSVQLAEGSISTTSGSEKWFDTPAGRLSHIVDPRSGRALPPRGSATVIHQRALVADLLSTALYVMGPDEGLRWADDNAVAAIFIVPDGSGWSVLTSREANNPGLGLTTVSADDQLKGNELNVP